jgi:hypothetical protein
MTSGAVCGHAIRCHRSLCRPSFRDRKELFYEPSPQEKILPPHLCLRNSGAVLVLERDRAAAIGSSSSAIALGRIGDVASRQDGGGDIEPQGSLGGSK